MNNVDKLVSIIIPAYNVENYIDKCLESVLDQTYKNIEVIVVDDGSSDDTWSHIEEFSNRDSRVRAFRRDNSGVSATRNFALDQANGYYIQFVDSDDYICEEATHKLVNAIETTNASWVNCQYNRIDDNGNQLEVFDFIKGIYVTDTEESRLKFIRDNLLEYRVGYEVCFKLFKASIIKEYNLRFNDKCRIGEDLAFNICYGFYADSIVCIEDRIYNYIIRSNTAMENAKSLKTNFEERLTLVKGIEPTFKNVFSGKTKDDFYQLFYKLMLLGCWKHTAEESLQMIKEVNDKYFEEYLSESLKHKSEFGKIFRPDLAMLYYKYGLYIDSYLNGRKLNIIYLEMYNMYRRLRKRDTLREWRLS
ncbi:glycosyltransferase [Butyrivibrio fibrisolvens]|uniref:glycosyltransferase family 2 protein n=1 Tax=Pseudobutyrivibrio ruminis TaxID=46206 RepID=UPI0004184082|nr:glycosyltransferase family 2 protein [Pseudobutyrivibrio ruminis]MDC7280503.1 glycosyltransferase [Butyrivibrio fibrisolvens]